MTIEFGITKHRLKVRSMYKSLFQKAFQELLDRGLTKEYWKLERIWEHARLQVEKGEI